MRGCFFLSLGSSDFRNFWYADRVRGLDFDFFGSFAFEELFELDLEGLFEARPRSSSISSIDPSIFTRSTTSVIGGCALNRNGHPISLTQLDDLTLDPNDDIQGITCAQSSDEDTSEIHLIIDDDSTI